MAVTYNIKGTTNSSFKVGKSGTGTAYLNTLSGDTISFSANLSIPNDTGKAFFGASEDLAIYHDGSHSHIRDQGTGDLRIRSTFLRLLNASSEPYILCASGGAVELYHNNSKKIETTSTGVSITGRSQFGTVDEYIEGDGVSVLTLASGGEIRLDGNATNVKSSSTNIANFTSQGSKLLVMTNLSQNVILETDVEDKDLIFRGNDGGSIITALTLDMSDGGTAIFNKDIKLGDSKNIEIGDSGDLRLYHDGSNSYIDDVGTGSIITRGSAINIQSDNLSLKKYDGSESYLVCTGDGAVEIRHDNTKVIETVSGGITVSGNATVTGNLTVQGATTSVSSTTIEVKDRFVFEGATDDSNELTLQAADPTSDRTITLPDETGILIVKDAVTGMIQLPVGTTAERPTPSAGMMRFNSTTKRFEGYNGIDWVPLSSSPSDLSSRDGTEVDVHASDFGKIT
tara:strand:+ start:1850 stop:3214 length:1365 start_codon:yes stop_codon:yes gene_type:complete